ncbi:MAG: hypothetical protein CL949_20320 [Erythrobacter sp.]|nr:hypothetical protein [Erythrobacter sp.]
MSHGACDWSPVIGSSRRPAPASPLHWPVGARPMLIGSGGKAMCTTWVSSTFQDAGCGEDSREAEDQHDPRVAFWNIAPTRAGSVCAPARPGGPRTRTVASA